MEIIRGYVYWVDLNPTRGSEIREKRPCLVVGANPLNRTRRTAVIIPLSSSGKPRYPVAIEVSCASTKAIAVIDQVRAIDKSRFLSKYSQLSHEDVSKVENGLKSVLAL